MSKSVFDSRNLFYITAATDGEENQTIPEEEKLERFYQLSKAAVYISDAVGLERHFCELLKKLLPCNAALVFHHQRSEGTFTAANYYNPEPNDRQNITIANDDAFIADLLLRQKSITRLNPQRPVLPGMRAELFVPLLSAQDLLGCLYLSRLNANAFQTLDVQFVEYAAVHLAFALERQQHQQHLRHIEKTAQHWRDKYVAFLQAMPLPAAVVDRQADHFDEVNDAALELFGCTQESFIDRPFSAVCSLIAQAGAGKFKAQLARACDQTRIECWAAETIFQEGDRQKSLFVFSSATPPTVGRPDDYQRRYALLQRLIARNLALLPIKEAVRALADELLQELPFDYLSLSLLEDGGAPARSTALCTQAVQSFLDEGSRWELIEGSVLGWIVQPQANVKRGVMRGLPFTLPVHFSSLLLHDGLHIGNLALGRLRDALSENDRQLIRDAAVLLASIISTSRRYESELRRLEQLAAVCAHELKSPIQNLRSFLQLLTDDYGAYLPEEPQTFLLRALTNVDGMEKTITDLIRFHRVGAKIEFSNVDIGDTVRSVCSKHSFFMLKHGVRLLLPSSWPIVRADAVGLEQIFNNLLSNAVNAAIKKPNPEVEIGFAEREAEYEFFVRNNGPALESARYEKIFEMFYTADWIKTGSGLGLPIVKRAVLPHGGTIRFESAEGEGTTFRFTLPKTIQQEP